MQVKSSITIATEVAIRVLRGLKFCVRSRPAPAGVWEILTAPAPQTIPTRARPALFRSQTRTSPKTTKNS